jgi:hypothetical protein
MYSVSDICKHGSSFIFGTREMDPEFQGFSTDDKEWLLSLGYTWEEVAVRITQGFTPSEIVNAVKVKLLHDKVEIAAYAALQHGIEDFQLVRTENTTELSEEQSHTLLHRYVKNAAHKVMRASDGYITLREKYLNAKQIEPVMSKVMVIITDRDSKLTRASYQCLEALVAALDEHNSMVNAILFNAWGVPLKKNYCHLTEIKAKAGYLGHNNEKREQQSDQVTEDSPSKKIRFTDEWASSKK